MLHPEPIWCGHNVSAGFVRSGEFMFKKTQHDAHSPHSRPGTRGPKIASSYLVFEGSEDEGFSTKRLLRGIGANKVTRSGVQFDAILEGGASEAIC